VSDSPLESISMSSSYVIGRSAMSEGIGGISTNP
jgi:hypothetical protein